MLKPFTVFIHSTALLVLSINENKKWPRQFLKCREPVDIFAFDDNVVAYCKCTGKHTGSWLGISAIYAHFYFYGIILFGFNDDKICDIWSCWDRLSLLQRLQKNSLGIHTCMIKNKN
jgi:hypothetical protein